MSFKEYNELNKAITDIYALTCTPCMQSTGFRKGDCKQCNVMNKYVRLQERKKRLEDENK